MISSISVCAAFIADLFAIATDVFDRRGFRDGLVCISVELMVSGSLLVIMGELFVFVEIISFSMDTVILDDSFLSVEIGGSFVCVGMILFSVDAVIVYESLALVCVISFMSLSMS